MSEEQAVRVEKNGPVTTIILSRPKAKNAVDLPTANALSDAFRAFERDDDARVAVLYGDHGTFCAGADLKTLGGERTNRVAPDGDGPMGPTRMLLEKPVIAAIEGYAVAGGLELAVWCDLRVAAEGAQMGVLCRRWGVPFIDGGTVRLPRLIGLSHALDLLLTARLVDANEAHRMGLVNRVVKDGKAREEAEKLASLVASFPQTCMRNDRKSAYEQASMTIDDAIQNELRHGMISLSSPELPEALMRFLSGAGRGGKL